MRRYESHRSKKAEEGTRNHAKKIQIQSRFLSPVERHRREGKEARKINQAEENPVCQESKCCKMKKDSLMCSEPHCHKSGEIFFGGAFLCHGHFHQMLPLNNKKELYLDI